MQEQPKIVVEFRSTHGVVTEVSVPMSGMCIANLPPGTYSVRGHLAKSNLWCTVGGDKSITVVKDRELHINIDCDAI